MNQLENIAKFIENMNAISKSVKHGGGFDHVEIFKWTKELMPAAKELNDRQQKLEDAVWALNDSLTKIHKHDPMAITNRDLNRMHTAQTLLKEAGLRK